MNGEKKTSAEKNLEKLKTRFFVPRHCPPALPREQPKTPPAAEAVRVSDETTEMLEVGRPRAVSSACSHFDIEKFSRTE
jgi:hypothetical protein